MSARGPGRTKTARAAAVATLCRWQAKNRPVDRLLRDCTGHLDSRDRRLAMQLVYGVLRHLDHLDRVIAGLSKHPLAKMKPETLMVLRVGIFQLQFCDRIPASAAVNETVKVLAIRGQPRWLTGFVNGVLRNAARQLADLQPPDAPAPDGRPILNHPEWLVQRWRQRYGPEATATLCRVNNSEPGTTLCANIRRTTRDGLLFLFEQASVPARAGDLTPEAVLLNSDAGPIRELPGYDHGLFFVQDQAAQLASRLLLPLLPEGQYLDGCAGLGGKTCHLAMHLPKEAALTAIEPDDFRFGQLAENLHRLGLDRTVTRRCMTLQEHAAVTTARYHGIFIDAPCSGTGVTRRHPDIRWNRQPEDLAAYCALQEDLLVTTARLLLPGGLLVYATCSLEPEENEMCVNRFLRDHPEFALESAAPHLPASARHLVNRQGHFAPLPGDTVDGFFAVRLRRRASS